VQLTEPHRSALSSAVLIEPQLCFSSGQSTSPWR
jgi:hypothetical protein